MEIERINRQYEIILASASPRRRELLTQIGIDFRVLTSDGEEITTKRKPEQIVMELASAKARDILARYRAERGVTEADRVISHAESSAANADGTVFPAGRDAAGENSRKPYLIIAADTIVAVDGLVLGKPKDEQDAVRMLTQLQGRSHQVYTGVMLLSPDKESCFYECTEVMFVPMTRSQIEEYVHTGEPLDKAGAYGIQGRFAAYVSRIEGDYFNVVGLPLARLMQEIGAGYCEE